jgi:cell division protein FtsA
MAANQPSMLAAGVDAGSAFTRCAILLIENARLRLAGYGEVRSQGWDKGRIADHSAVSNSIERAVREAERLAQASIGSAVFGVGGTGICGASGHGGCDIGIPRQIGQGDVNRVVNRAARTQVREDEMILHVAPRDFAVDGRHGHRNPRGMIGSRLEVYVHLVMAPPQEHRALVGAANLAHLAVEETVFEPIAASYAAILPEERCEPVVLIDIGAHSTGLAVYDGEMLVLTSSLPICGGHFTRDVARGLTISPEDAEWLKEQQGSALPDLSGGNGMVELPPAAGRGNREARLADLNLILEARAADLFEFVAHELERAGADQTMMGAVLTGGGARLPGMCDVAEKVLKCQARNGLPVGILDWPAAIDNPSWTTAAGLAMYSARLQLRAELDRKTGSFLTNFLK